MVALHLDHNIMQRWEARVRSAHLAKRESTHAAKHREIKRRAPWMRIRRVEEGEADNRRHVRALRLPHEGDDVRPASDRRHAKARALVDAPVRGRHRRRRRRYSSSSRRSSS